MAKNHHQMILPPYSEYSTFEGDLTYIFKENDCISKGYIHKAVIGNKSHCPAHLHCWYPLHYERGIDLHGM
eukprot:10578891-Ditylum_brightwellii.AAC.1